MVLKNIFSGLIIPLKVEKKTLLTFINHIILFYYLSSCVVSVVDADFFKKDDDDNNDDEDDDDAVVDLSMPESSFNRLR